jgi:hypothetical protein
MGKDDIISADRNGKVTRQGKGDVVTADRDYKAG